MPGGTICSMNGCSKLASFPFPTDKNLRKIWTNACNRDKDWTPTSLSQICRFHYHSNYFFSYTGKRPETQAASLADARIQDTTVKRHGDPNSSNSESKRVCREVKSSREDNMEEFDSHGSNLRIVDLNLLQAALGDMRDGKSKGKTCGHGRFQLNELENCRDGFFTEFVLSCQTCKSSVKFPNTKPGPSKESSRHINTLLLDVLPEEYFNILVQLFTSGESIYVPGDIESQDMSEMPSDQGEELFSTVTLKNEPIEDDETPDTLIDPICVDNESKDHDEESIDQDQEFKNQDQGSKDPESKVQVCDNLSITLSSEEAQERLKCNDDISKALECEIQQELVAIVDMLKDSSPRKCKEKGCISTTSADVRKRKKTASSENVAISSDFDSAKEDSKDLSENGTNKSEIKGLEEDVTIDNIVKLEPEVILDNFEDEKFEADQPNEDEYKVKGGRVVPWPLNLALPPNQDQYIKKTCSEFSLKPGVYEFERDGGETSVLVLRDEENSFADILKLYKHQDQESTTETRTLRQLQRAINKNGYVLCSKCNLGFLSADRLLEHQNFNCVQSKESADHVHCQPCKVKFENLLTFHKHLHLPKFQKQHSSIKKARVVAPVRIPKKIPNNKAPLHIFSSFYSERLKCASITEDTIGFQNVDRIIIDLWSRMNSDEKATFRKAAIDQDFHKDLYVFDTVNYTFAAIEKRIFGDSLDI